MAKPGDILLLNGDSSSDRTSLLEALQNKLAEPEIQCSGPHLGLSTVCAPILRALPAWFGIEAATQQYLEAVDALPTVLAEINGQVEGFLTLKQHSPQSAEIYVMGVRPERHRRGVGQALLHHAQRFLLAQGVEFLQVKTLSSAHPDPGYAKTRAFYQAMGFHPLEEFPTLWGAENPCLMLIKHL